MDDGNSKAIEFLKILWRNRKFLVVFNSSVFVVSLLYCLLAPKWYMSKVTFMVETEMSAIPLTSIVVETPFATTSWTRTETSKYLAMLYSRTILDSLIEEFDLGRVYGIDNRDELYDELLENIIIWDNQDNTVTIMCYYKDDKFKAAKMANSYFRYLKNMDRRLQRQRASEFRKYMEENYIRAQEELRAAEDSLADYQDRYGLVDIDEQIKEIIGTVADLESRKITYEMEKEYMTRVAGTRNPELYSLADKIDILDRKIQSIYEDSLYTKLVIGEMPRRKMEFIRLYREVVL